MNLEAERLWGEFVCIVLESLFPGFGPKTKLVKVDSNTVYWSEPSIVIGSWSFSSTVSITSTEPPTCQCTLYRYFSDLSVGYLAEYDILFYRELGK